MKLSIALLSTLVLTTPLLSRVQQEPKWSSCQRIIDLPTHRIADIRKDEASVRIKTTDGIVWTVDGEQSNWIGRNIIEGGDDLVIYRSLSLTKQYWMHHPKSGRYIFAKAPTISKSDKPAYSLYEVNLSEFSFVIETAKGEKETFLLPSSETERYQRALKENPKPIHPLEQWEKGDILTFASNRSLNFANWQTPSIKVININKNRICSIYFTNQQMEQFNKFFFTRPR